MVRYPGRHANTKNFRIHIQVRILLQNKRIKLVGGDGTMLTYIPVCHFCSADEPYHNLKVAFEGRYTNQAGFANVNHKTTVTRTRSIHIAHSLLAPIANWACHFVTFIGAMATSILGIWYSNRTSSAHSSCGSSFQFLQLAGRVRSDISRLCH